MRTVLGGVVLVTLAAVASDAGQFKLDHVVLYQPEAVYEARSVTAQALSEYLKQLRAICEQTLATASTPETMDIVVAVKPGRLSRVWIMSSRASDDRLLALLKARLEAVQPMDIAGGPVVFGIASSLAGAPYPVVPNSQYQPRIPQEWRDAAAHLPKPVLIPDDILRAVWP